MIRAPMIALLGALLAVSVARPAAAAWVKTQGERLFGPELSEQEACQIAARKAKDRALKSVTGERLSSEDLMVCKETNGNAGCDLNQFTWSVIDGEIRGVRNRKTHTEASIGGYRKCIVDMEVDVGMPKGHSDPGFDMAVKLNQTVYRDGDDMKVSIDPNAPMYVTVFEWLPYDSSPKQVSRLFPNEMDKDNLFKTAASVPTKQGSQLYDLEVRFPKNMPASRRMVDEYLMVVGTRKPIKFRDSYTLEEFNSRLLEIPLDDSRRIKRAYAVVRQ